MALSEIEKLERRYAENPQGLTFAPLAEVYRKNGDPQRALSLLQPGLELHPDYIPASIVLGRCHLDLGDQQAAESAFTHVLALDGENVIALKALADINERLMRFDDAERWLNTLLSIDRSNDDARDQLNRVEQSRRQAEVASSVDPSSLETTLVSDFGSEGAAASASELPVEHSPLAEISGAWVSPADSQDTSAATPLLLEDLEPSPVRIDDPGPTGLELEEPHRLEEPVTPLADLVGRDVDTPDQGRVEWDVERSEEIVLRSSGGSEFQVPDASQELSARAVPEPSPFGEPAPIPTPEPAGEPAATVAPQEPAAASDEPPVPWAYEPIMVEAAGMVPPSEPEEADAPKGEIEERPTEPVPAEPVSAEPAGVPFAPPEPEPIVTETMAEVLLQQGHTLEALVLYRELASRTGDPRLQQKVAELEVAQAAPPRLTRFTAADTGGRSVGDFLRAILAARPPMQTAAPSPARAPAGGGEGAPTRPAAEALSLSSVFGEEPAAGPPAVPAPAPERDRVSFDEFYSASAPAPATRGGRSAEPKKDDLDEFHAWLQNLKR